MQPHPALSAIIAIVIAILTASFLYSVGYAIVQPAEYNEFCDLGPYPDRFNGNATDEELDAYNEAQQECQEAYDEARERVQNWLFYIVSGLGVLVIIGALYVHSPKVDLKFYLTAGVIFGAIAAILFSTMQNWSEFTRYVRPFVLLIEIALVTFVAIRLFSSKQPSKRKR